MSKKIVTESCVVFIMTAKERHGTAGVKILNNKQSAVRGECMRNMLNRPKWTKLINKTPSSSTVFMMVKTWLEGSNYFHCKSCRTFYDFYELETYLFSIFWVLVVYPSLCTFVCLCMDRLQSGPARWLSTNRPKRGKCFQYEVCFVKYWSVHLLKIHVLNFLLHFRDLFVV